jgi:phosphate-selective porin OprO/OprP
MNELSFRRALCGVLGITALVSLPGAFAAAAPTPEALAAQVAELSARIKALESTLASLKAATPAPAPVATSATPQNVDARVRVIERRLEVNAEEAAATRAKVPAVSVGEKGLAVTSPDGNYELKLRGYIQTDARFFLDDESQSNADSFLIRRVRPIFEGTVAKQFYYRVMPDFAGASVTLQDAYAEWRQYPFAKVAVGKMKEPVGLERLASGSELPFVERGITNNLVPNRDVGLQVSGELLDGKLSYQTGVFDGDPDGENVAALDSSDDKDFAGRLMVQPFLDAYGPLQGLGFGISGT